MYDVTDKRVGIEDGNNSVEFHAIEDTQQILVIKQEENLSLEIKSDESITVKKGEFGDVGEP